MRIIEKGEFVEENLILNKIGEEKNEYIYENYRNEYIYLLDSEIHENENKKNNHRKNDFNYSEIEEDINLSSMLNEEDIIIDSTELNKIKNINHNHFYSENEKNFFNKIKEKNENDLYLNDDSSKEKQTLSINDKDISNIISNKILKKLIL